jgi:hypothetical protein
VRKQHDQVDIVETRERIDRGAAGIARCCDHDGGALRALRQHVIHQPRDQLHRDVLERQRRAVKQLQQELIGTDLVQRNHGRMAERRIGLVRHAPEIGVGDFTADKRPDHVDSDFPIRPAEKSGNGLRRKPRPGFGHVKAAVAGEPGQHHVAESKCGGLPPRRNIPRQSALQRLWAPTQAFDIDRYSTFADGKAGRHHKAFSGQWEMPQSREDLRFWHATSRHTPRMRGIQYAAASRPDHGRLWKTASSAGACHRAALCADPVADDDG